MRRSFDALALAVRERLALDPESGALFVFASRRGNRLKVLWFDHNGLCIFYKAPASRNVRPARAQRRRPSARIDRRAHACNDRPRRPKRISVILSR
jgi:transposase